MKFTLSWLYDHLETEATLEDILYALTDLGLEVEEVSNPGDRLKDFTIGKVISAEKHPDADKLKVCQVDTDEGSSQIICGAPNARAGITVVIAKPGPYVPGIDTTLGVGKIRGLESFGFDRYKDNGLISPALCFHQRVDGCAGAKVATQSAIR